MKDSTCGHEKVPLEADDAALKIAEARQNLAMLEACRRPHAFENVNPASAALFRIWHRRLCGGEISEPSHRWYERGLAHGRAEAREKRAAQLAEAIAEGTRP